MRLNGNSTSRIRVSNSKYLLLSTISSAFHITIEGRALRADRSTRDNRELGKNTEKRENDNILEGQESIKSEKTLMS